VQTPDVSQWGKADWGIKAPLADGQGLRLDNALIGSYGEVLDEALASHGMSPRGAVAEPNTPDFGFRITRKIDCWADDVPELYERAKAEQWDATRDIPWHKLPELHEDLERAVCQIMTFLVENEYVALYLPSKFISRIDPHYTEVSLLLATQVKDEARHIEVYTKRALANGGGLQYVSASTQWALKSLITQENYVKASFLLHVLGEGTFLDMLKFIEDIAPDPVTREILVRTRQDEARHVGYGVSHVRYLLREAPGLAEELLEAAEERASFLRATSGANPFLQRSLATLAGGGGQDEQLERGAERVREFYKKMHETRIHRLTLAGLDERTARKIAELHGGGGKAYM
jgi:hypothetical protein